MERKLCPTTLVIWRTLNSSQGRYPLLTLRRSRSRINGATQTFRRPSVATNPTHTRESSHAASASTPTSGAYVPPHMSSNSLSSGVRNGDARYSKDQLIDLYKVQRESGSLGKNVEDYFVADWDPHMVPTPVNGAWGKRDDHKTSAGPEVCWDHNGQAEPLSLSDMTDSEKEVGPVYASFGLWENFRLTKNSSSSLPRPSILLSNPHQRTPRRKTLGQLLEVAKGQFHTPRATLITTIPPPPPPTARV